MPAWHLRRCREPNPCPHPASVLPNELSLQSKGKVFFNCASVFPSACGFVLMRAVAHGDQKRVPDPLEYWLL